MRSIITGIFIVVCRIPFAAAGPEGTRSITVTAATPLVSVLPGEPGRQFVELPALDYSFDVEARCNDEWIPTSLLLTVADSRAAFGASQLADGDHQKFVLHIPQRQLSPIAIHDFCNLGSATDPLRFTTKKSAEVDESALTVKAVLSAHASLLCRNDAEQRITYVSTPLDVTLKCSSTPEVADQRDQDFRQGRSGQPSGGLPSPTARW